jgi:competence protein ComEC
MKDYPVIKISFFFIAGILVSHFIEPPQPFYLYIFLLALVLALILKLMRQNKFISIASSLVIYIAIFSAAVLLALMQKENIHYLPADLYKEKDVTAYGKVTSVELFREYEIRFKLLCDSVHTKDVKFIKQVTLLCRIRDTDQKKLRRAYENTLPGNYISFNGTYSKGREKRNPGEFDYDKFLKSQGISGIITAYQTSGMKKISEYNVEPQTSLFILRRYVDDMISNLHNDKTASLLKGLLLGDRSEISYDTKNEFINSGVIHVLAVSGLHVGYILLIFIVVFGRFNLYMKSFLTIAGLILYMFITGLPPSVFRASVMAIILILAFLTNRSTNLFNSLFLAALIILLLDTQELFNPGFQLSFSAVFAIAAIYPIIQRKIDLLKLKHGWIKYILLFMAVSLSAQLGTLPFTLVYFGKLSLVALVVNLFVIPLIGLIVGIGIVTLLFSFFTPLAAVYASSNELFSSILFSVVSFSGNLDFSHLRIINFTLYDAVVYYLLLLTFFFCMIKFQKIISRIIVSVLITVNLMLFLSLDNKELLTKNELNIFIIDVGQGDAILIKFPNGKTALVDAGDANLFFDNGERIVAPLLDYLGIEKINYGYVSHLDADHYGGFHSLIKSGRIEHVVKPLKDTSLAKDVKFEKFLSQHEVPFSYYQRGIQKEGNTNIYIFNDDNDVIYKKLSTNDKSGVVKIVFGNTDFLFTGDIERKAEVYYAERYKQMLKSHVLKVAHHGSKTSSAEKFIQFVEPKISLISVGIQNKFKHPSEQVIERLKSSGSEILRTDLMSAILLRSDGKKIKIIDWKKDL